MKTKYLLLTALLIGASPHTAKSSIKINSLDQIKEYMSDFCIPQENTTCNPKTEATYNGGKCICNASGYNWYGTYRFCGPTCPKGSAVNNNPDAEDCPKGYIRINV